MKYILVTGGVISGVGKGVISSSFGAILKCCGIEVTSIKIDPYINIDAGTFSPYEHGKYLWINCILHYISIDNVCVSFNCIFMNISTAYWINLCHKKVDKCIILSIL